MIPLEVPFIALDDNGRKLTRIKKSTPGCARQGARQQAEDDVSSADPEHGEERPGKRHETLAFLFLAFVLFPVLAIVFIGGFGFVVWMQHLLVGPPGS